MPELLAAFGKTHPDVYFHSIQSDSSESISRVLDGTVDLALVGQNTRDESCVFIPFCHDELVIATPVTDHYLALKDRETPAVHSLRYARTAETRNRRRQNTRRPDPQSARQSAEESGPPHGRLIRLILQKRRHLPFLSAEL